MRRTLTRRSLLAAATVFAAALTSAPATAQDAPNRHRAVITTQLDKALEVKRTEGFAAEPSIDSKTMIGMLPNRGAVILEITLRSGVEYFISAGCDADCDDLDLSLHAPGDQAAMAKDVEDDDVPLLAFTAARAGPHLLTVSMASCKTEMCYFGFRVLGK